MKFISRLRNIALLLFATLLFCMCNEQKRLASTDILLKQVPFVKTMVGNQHVWLLIDTGSSVSVLDSTFVSQNNFKAHASTEQVIVHASGIKHLHNTTKQRVTIKNTTANIDFYVANMSPMLQKMSSTLDKQVVGILGCDYLAATGALIDVQNKQLLLVSIFNKLNNQ